MPAIVKIDGVEKKRVWVDELSAVVESKEVDSDIKKALEIQWKHNKRNIYVELILSEEEKLAEKEKEKAKKAFEKAEKAEKAKAKKEKAIADAKVKAEKDSK